MVSNLAGHQTNRRTSPRWRSGEGLQLRGRGFCRIASARLESYSSGFSSPAPLLLFLRDDPRQNAVLGFRGFFENTLVYALLLGRRRIANELRKGSRLDGFGFAFEREHSVNVYCRPSMRLISATLYFSGVWLSIRSIPARRLDANRRCFSSVNCGTASVCR